MHGKADHNQIRQALIEGVITVVSDHGLEGLTTRKIAEACGQNEAYIYRYFFNVSDLLQKAFFTIEDRYFTDVTLRLKQLLAAGYNSAEVLKQEFTYCWKYATDSPAECKFYNRYYNSSYFTEDVRDKHDITLIDFTQALRSLFKPGTDIDKIFHHVFVCLLDYANKIAMGVMANDENDIKETYEMLSRMMTPYMTLIPERRKI